MKRPASLLPRSARQIPQPVARSRREAAIQLVRVEFDVSRLELGIAQAQDRLDRSVEALEQRRRRRAALLALLKP